MFRQGLEGPCLLGQASSLCPPGLAKLPWERRRLVGKKCGVKKLGEKRDKSCKNALHLSAFSPLVVTSKNDIIYVKLRASAQPAELE